MTESDAYTGQVRASDVAFPRGGVWMYLGWFAVATVVLLWADRDSAMFDFIAPVMALPAATTIWIFRTRGSQSFSADAGGLTFGRRPGQHRHERALAWSDIQELRVRAIQGGTLLEIFLSPGAIVEYRSPAHQVADLAYMFFVPVIGVGHNVPAIALPRANPPRYRIPLLRVTPAELRDALALYAPGTPIDMAG